jgi:glycosyltransferase involved in cell wall biosynthesis
LRPHAGFNVGYIGTVDSFKMHPRYVPMSAGIQVPDAHFVVCGPGNLEQLQAQTRDLGAADRFDFRGYVNDIKPVIETFDVYGYPLCESTYASEN